VDCAAYIPALNGGVLRTKHDKNNRQYGHKLEHFVASDLKSFRLKEFLGKNVGESFIFI